MNIVAAVATDDGNKTIERHFGDAEKYSIYEISYYEHKLIKTIINNSGSETGKHADPEKAGNVATMLKKEEVNTAVARSFGPNLKKIKKKFVCVIVEDECIETVLEKLQAEAAGIHEEHEKGPERGFLRIH